MSKEVIIVGAGFSGATCARLLAENGFKVTVIDKFSHVGGNAYDEMQDGIFVHKYGPHIFHSNSEEVFAFLSRFTEWFTYEHRVLAKLKNCYVPVPFNLESLKRCFSEKDSQEIQNILCETYGGGSKVSVLQLRQNENEKIREFAEFVVQNIFVRYSEKQWGTTLEKLDPATIARVPVYCSFEDRYFTDKFQCQPLNGYTKLFENMLSHKNISLMLQTEAKSVLKIEKGKLFHCGKEFSGHVIFTGPVDEFLNFEFGKLPYRTLRFEFEDHKMDSFQPAAVVNYTVSEDFTRISEFKKFTTKNPPKNHTVIVKEFSLAYEPNNGMIPYYPIINSDNLSIFEKYQNCCQKIENFHLLGRLGNYKYINMDAAVSLAMELSKKIIKGEKE